MSSFMALALYLAMTAWGYAGTTVHISYTVLPENVVGLAYGDIDECWIELDEGFEFYERTQTNLDHLVFMLTHEYGHCIRDHGHNEDPCSLMYYKLSYCYPQVITNMDRLIAKEYRDRILINKIIVGGY